MLTEEDEGAASLGLLLWGSGSLGLSTITWEGSMKMKRIIKPLGWSV